MSFIKKLIAKLFAKKSDCECESLRKALICEECGRIH